jgi:plasmid stabilization system protein ParE
LRKSLTYEVSLSLRALADADEIVDFLFMKSPRSAERFYRAVDSIVETLDAHPNRGASLRYRKLGVLRHLPMKSFPRIHVFYKVYRQEKRVLILRILHLSRDISAEL